MKISTHILAQVLRHRQYGSNVTRVHVLGGVDSKAGNAHVNEIVKEGGYFGAYIVAVVVEVE